MWILFLPMDPIYKNSLFHHFFVLLWVYEWFSSRKVLGVLMILVTLYFFWNMGQQSEKEHFFFSFFQ